MAARTAANGTLSSGRHGHAARAPLDRQTRDLVRAHLDWAEAIAAKAQLGARLMTGAELSSWLWLVRTLAARAGCLLAAPAPQPAPQPAREGSCAAPQNT
jgi:hypothetical protein